LKADKANLGAIAPRATISRKLLDASIGAVHSVTIETEDGSFYMDFPESFPDDIEATLREIVDVSKAKFMDRSQPRHIRFIAKTAGISAESALDRIKTGHLNPSGVATKSAAGFAYTAGFYYGRLLVVSAERDARSGAKSRNAAGRKGRTAPAGSLREFFERTLPSGWRAMPRVKLFQLARAQPQFKSRSQESLLRQISALKELDNRA
jgi:hypothetical protein